MKAISFEDKKDIILYLQQYHSAKLCNDPSIQDIAPYFPQIFHKIKGNLECYLITLENNKKFNYM
jgi:hypothetical protein